MASQVTLKALGLNYSPNNLSLPEGSLIVADDVIVRRDNVIESRRGFREYSEEFGTIDDRSNQLIVYKDRILNHYNNILQYDTGLLNNEKAVFNNFNGTYNEVENGLRIKSIEANKNLYFTTDLGIKKISARTADDFTTATGFIENAGGVKATDFTATLNITQGQTSGFLPVDSATAYRVLWGYKDLNENLILGAPSNSVSVYNYLSNIVSLDLNTFLIALDNCIQNTSTFSSVLHNSSTYGTETFSFSENFSDKFKVDITDDASIYAANLTNTAEYIDKFATLGDAFSLYTFTGTALGVNGLTANDVYRDLLTGNDFTVIASAVGGAALNTVTFRGNGDPATGIVSPATVLTKQSGNALSQTTITYTSYTNTLPNNKPLQISEQKTYVFTTSFPITVANGNPAPVTSSVPHGLPVNSTTEQVFISGTSTTAASTGLRTVTVTGITSFTLTGVNVTAITTATGTASTVTAAIANGDIYRDANTGNIFVASAAAQGAATVTFKGSNNPSAFLPLGSVLTLDRITGTGPTTLRYQSYTVTESGFSATSGIGSIDFTSDPSTVFSEGDLIEVVDAVDGKSNTYDFTINKRYLFTLSAAPATLIPTFSTFTTNGQTFTTIPPSAPFAANFTFNGPSLPSGPAIATSWANGDVYGFTDPNTGFTFRYTVSGAVAPGTLTAQGVGYISTGAGILYKISGNPLSASVIQYTTLTLPAASASLPTTGTGSPTPPGAATSGTLTGSTISPVFNSYVQTDSSVPIGSVYTNNSQRFLVTGYNSLSTVSAVGTNEPNSLASTTILSLRSGTGETLLQYSAVNRGTASYTSFNNTSIGTNPNNFWTITSVDSTNKKIFFNVSSTTNISSGFAGAAVKVLSYNYRNIIQTGDALFTTPLSDLVVSTPATSEQLRIIQNTLNRLSNRLKNEKSGYISSTLKTTYINNYSITSFANVDLNITIPQNIPNVNYFLQVYRTRNFTATGVNILGVDVTPDEEMRLVYEAFPINTLTPLPISFSFLDEYPEALRDNNVNLYTNPVTGEGISQANDIPPVAKDINRFKNTVFYANTKTRHRLNPFQLIGTSNINTGDTITISNGTVNSVYEFVEGVQEVTRIAFGAGITPANLQNNYFEINSAEDKTQYYVWYRVDNSGTASSPPSGKTPIRVDILTGDTPTIIRDKTLNVINAFSLDFIAEKYNTYTFTVSGGPTVTAGDVYLNNDVTYTVVSLVGTTLTCTGPANPQTSGTLQKVSGNALSSDTISYSAFSLTSSLALNVTNTNFGITTNASTNPSISAFVTITTPVEGNGENATPVSGPPKVLLSKVSAFVTASQAIDETARSLVRIINKQSSSTVTAYYISNSTSLPGQINLESELINDIPFYVQASTVDVGTSFNPNIEPYEVETSANGAQINYISTNLVEFRTETSPGAGKPHNLNNGDKIFISLATVLSPTQYFNGIFTVTVVDAYRFRITITTSGFTSGSNSFNWSKLSDVSASNNETKPNRVYYSKISQPESVPLLNYFDIGASDKQILRIFPLRDSLFVFKEDGLYRISGEVAPFVVGLFDSSCILIAPDSVSVANNIVYGWTTKGISNVTEAGVTEISRPIDIAVLKLASSNYTNFRTATWGLGYDSDNSYTVYTCENTEDELATIGFRFSNLTNTWTNIKRSQTCGVIRLTDDRIYTGSGSNNVIDQERKSFDRTDYADKDFDLSIANNFLNNGQITLPSVLGIEPGDVITQTQGLTVYKFNALLDKLDFDPIVGRYGYSVSTLGSTTITVKTRIYGTSTPQNHNLSTGDWINVDSSNTTPSIDGQYQISNTFDISSISVANPTTITTDVEHGLTNGDIVIISGTNTTASTNGSFAVTVTGTNTFTIPVNVTSVTVTGNESFLSPKSFTIDIPIALTTGTTGTLNTITRDYSQTFAAQAGDNLRTKLVALASYLDTDPSLTPLAGVTYSDIIASKSGIVNDVDTGNPALITSSSPSAPAVPSLHELIDGRVVTISGTNVTIIPSIQNTYQVNVTGPFPSNFTTSTSFEIPVNVTTGNAYPTGLSYSTGVNLETVEDILACYNGIINLLNQPTSGTSFKTYSLINNTTLFEAVVVSVNKPLNYITINLPIQLVVGDIKIYKAIKCDAVYSPITFGDPLQLKQVYEATLMFSNKAFNKVIAGFSSDLKPEFTYVEFEGQGNGMFGNYSQPGFGYGFFGGASNAAPCRTLIPRQNQRCRYINMEFSHATARELWSLYGITLTFNPTQSTRAYR